MINRYLRFPADESAEIPRRVYALVDEFDILPDGSAFVRLDTVGGDWLEGALRTDLLENWASQERRNIFFAEAPLFGIEIHTADFSDQLETYFLLNLWLEIDLSAPGAGFEVAVFKSLFGEGNRRSAHIVPASLFVRASLTALDPFDNVPSVDQADVEAILSRGEDSENVAVYDVGQGNMNALCDGDGRPLLYFDLGGSIQGNKHSFPHAFSSACFSAQPPIILSHWDKDHWSSAQRFPNSFDSKWLVPHQLPLGMSHRAHVQSLVSRGNLLVSRRHRNRYISGRSKLVHGNGPLRNNSGLSLYVSGRGPLANEAMLLPADADYQYVPDAFNQNLLSIVASHHGATIGNRGAPRCLGKPYSRLVYSCGSPNTFGHPTMSARNAHHAAGWHDASVNAGGADITRLTTLRGPRGYGHVSMHWQSVNQVPTVNCIGCNAPCELKITQI